MTSCGIFPSGDFRSGSLRKATTPAQVGYDPDVEAQKLAFEKQKWEAQLRTEEEAEREDKLRREEAKLRREEVEREEKRAEREAQLRREEVEREERKADREDKLRREESEQRR